MKNWETELYTAIIYNEVQKSHQIVREHAKLVSAIPQEMVDQMFEHSVASNPPSVGFFTKNPPPVTVVVKVVPSKHGKKQSNSTTIVELDRR